MTAIHNKGSHEAATIGVIMLDTVFPRIPGDIGNLATFSFPVRYKVVRGATPQRVVKEADPNLLEPFIEAARELEKEGVKAITTSCGFLAIFHQEMVNAVDIPVFSSSLLEVHIAHAMISRHRKVGVLTANAKALTKRHFAGVGIRNIPLAVMGMENAEEFTETFIEGKLSPDFEKIRQEVVGAAEKLSKLHRDIGAIVLECANMPPYAKDIQKVLKVPVFDVVTMIQHVHASLERKEFQ
jgi:Asp/Glu/hydantoin racemase